VSEAIRVMVHGELATPHAVANTWTCAAHIHTPRSMSYGWLA